MNAYVSLLRLGAKGVLPLAAAARTEDPEVRRIVAHGLGAIGDARALAVVLEIKEAGKTDGIERLTAKLLDRHGEWAADGSASSAYLFLARR